jgi:hypothetical protein
LSSSSEDDSDAGPHPLVSASSSSSEDDSDAGIVRWPESRPPPPVSDSSSSSEDDSNVSLRGVTDKPYRRTVDIRPPPLVSDSDVSSPMVAACVYEYLHGHELGPDMDSDDDLHNLEPDDAPHKPAVYVTTVRPTATLQRSTLRRYVPPRRLVPDYPSMPALLPGQIVYAPAQCDTCARLSAPRCRHRELREYHAHRPLTLAKYHESLLCEDDVPDLVSRSSSGSSGEDSDPCTVGIEPAEMQDIQSIASGLDSIYSLRPTTSLSPPSR